MLSQLATSAAGEASRRPKVAWRRESEAGRERGGAQKDLSCPASNSLPRARRVYRVPPRVLRAYVVHTLSSVQRPRGDGRILALPGGTRSLIPDTLTGAVDDRDQRARAASGRNPVDLFVGAVEPVLDALSLEQAEP